MLLLMLLLLLYRCKNLLVMPVDLVLPINWMHIDINCSEMQEHHGNYQHRLVIPTVHDMAVDDKF